MSVRVEVVCVNPDGSEQRREVLTIEARELAMETLGMNLSEGKALLAAVQDFVVAQQVYEYLEQRRVCPHCRGLYTSKDSGSTVVSTVFGRVEVANPRWNRCPCQTDGPNTFRPMRTWLNGQTSPEMLYLETKWASLIPFARVADLLKEVLPVGDSVNQETVRTHLYATAERIEQELGEERQLNLFEGSEEDWEQQPLPDGPITVGIDGGYVRAAHKQGWFEVIAGRSVVAFRRDDESERAVREVFRIRANVRRETAPAIVGAHEVTGDAGEPAGRVHVRRRRKCAPGTGVSASVQRTSDRLVPHHDAADCAATADKGTAGRTATDRS